MSIAVVHENLIHTPVTHHPETGEMYVEVNGAQYPVKPVSSPSHHTTIEELLTCGTPVTENVEEVVLGLEKALRLHQGDESHGLYFVEKPATSIVKQYNAIVLRCTALVARIPLKAAVSISEVKSLLNPMAAWLYDPGKVSGDIAGMLVGAQLDAKEARRILDAKPLVISRKKPPIGDPLGSGPWAEGDSPYFQRGDIVGLLHEAARLDLIPDTRLFMAHSPRMLALHLASWGEDGLGSQLVQEVFETQSWGDKMLGVAVHYDLSVPPNVLKLVQGRPMGHKEIARLETTFEMQRG